MRPHDFHLDIGGVRHATRENRSGVGVALALSELRLCSTGDGSRTSVKANTGVVLRFKKDSRC